jgi:hypothetical protein
MRGLRLHVPATSHLRGRSLPSDTFLAQPRSAGRPAGDDLPRAPGDDSRQLRIDSKRPTSGDQVLRSLPRVPSSIIGRASRKDHGDPIEEDRPDVDRPSGASRGASTARCTQPDHTERDPGSGHAPHLLRRRSPHLRAHRSSTGRPADASACFHPCPRQRATRACSPPLEGDCEGLRAWVVTRGQPLATELFLNAQGNPLTRSGFEYILRKYVALAASDCPSIAAKRVSPHVLRHSCAMHVLNATRDVRGRLPCGSAMQVSSPPRSICARIRPRNSRHWKPVPHRRSALAASGPPKGCWQCSNPTEASQLMRSKSTDFGMHDKPKARMLCITLRST